MNEIERATEQLDVQIKNTVNAVSIKSCQLAIEALEKQIPKKPKTTPYNYHCCDCGEALGVNVNKRWTNFCPHCGSAID